MCSVGHQHQTWEEELKSVATRAQPSGLPHLGFGFSRVTTLQTPRATVTAVSELSKHPRARVAAAVPDGFLHVRGAGGSLQTKEPGVATFSPCRDHRDAVTCWCCHSTGMAFAQPAPGHTEAMPSWHSPPHLHLHLHAHDRAGPILRLVWVLLGYFGYFTSWLCSGCIMPSATSSLCTGVFTPVLYQLME